MPRYNIQFVCTVDGYRTDGVQAVDTPNPIPSLQHAQKYFTDMFRGLVQQSTGREITDLTITNIGLA